MLSTWLLPCVPLPLLPLLTSSLCHSVLPPAIGLIYSIIVLSFWLVNLVIAVITSSFQVTRDEMQQSGFVSKRQQYHLPVASELTVSEQLKDDGASSDHDDRPVSWGQKLYDQTSIIWIALIVVDLIIQAFRTSHMSDTTRSLLSMPSIPPVADCRRHRVSNDGGFRYRDHHSVHRLLPRLASVLS